MRLCVVFARVCGSVDAAATYPSTFHGAIQHENRLGVLFPTHQPKVAACCGERTLWQRGRWKQKLENSYEYCNEDQLLLFFKKKVKAKGGRPNEAVWMRHRKSSFNHKRQKIFLPQFLRYVYVVLAICWILLVYLIFTCKDRINGEINIKDFES